MKKIIMIALTMCLIGCQTTFEQRKQVYVAIYKEAKRIVIKLGPIAAQLYLDKKVANGDITEDEKQQILAIAQATLKKDETK